MERYYETVFILRPTLNDQEITDSIDSYRSLLVREGAEMLYEEDLGKRKLAYTIGHFQNGHYGLFQYRSAPAAVSELERTFKISEDILRFLTVRRSAAEVKEKAPEAAKEAPAAAAPEAPAPEAEAAVPAPEAPAEPAPGGEE